jgi:hypothetical protein
VSRPAAHCPRPRSRSDAAHSARAMEEIQERRSIVHQPRARLGAGCGILATLPPSQTARERQVIVCGVDRGNLRGLPVVSLVAPLEEPLHLVTHPQQAQPPVRTSRRGSPALVVANRDTTGDDDTTRGAAHSPMGFDGVRSDDIPPGSEGGGQRGAGGA